MGEVRHFAAKIRTIINESHQGTVIFALNPGADIPKYQVEPMNQGLSLIKYRTSRIQDTIFYITKRKKTLLFLFAQLITQYFQ